MLARNKTIIVTGGGSGIGRELVLNLLNRGARVAAVDLNKATLEETRQLAGDKAKALSLHELNIADRAAVEALPDAVIAAHGQADGLINCAGIIQPFVKVNKLDYSAIERVMNVNFYGSLYMIKAFLPHFLSRPEAHIVNISSMGGFLPVPGQSVYGASKAAVKLLTEGLYSELKETAVRVTIVFPGAVGTNIVANSGLGDSLKQENTGKQSMKALAADRAAEMIISGMEGNKFRVLVGSDARFMDFICRLAPEFATNFIFKKMKNLLKD